MSQDNASSYTFANSYKKVYIVLVGGRTKDVTSYVQSISLSNGVALTVDYYKTGVQNKMGETIFDTTGYVAHSESAIPSGTTLTVQLNYNAWYHAALIIIGLK